MTSIKHPLNIVSKINCHCLINARNIFFCMAFFILHGCSEPPTDFLKLAEKGVIATAISHDGQYGVVVSSNHDSAMWNLSKKKYLYTLKHHKKKQANIIAVAFNSDGKFLLTAEKKSIVLWQTKTGKLLANYKFDSPIQAIALSASGEQALIGFLNAKALYIDLNDGNVLTSLSHTETINTVALSADGRYALTGADDHFAVLWDLKNAKVLHKLKHKKKVVHVAFSPDIKTILTCGAYEYVRLWHLKTGRLRYKMNDKPISLSSIRFSSDSRLLALGIFSGKIKVWQLNKQHPELYTQYQLAKPDFWRPSATIVRSLAFARNGDFLLSLDSRGMVSWWSLNAPS